MVTFVRHVTGGSVQATGSTRPQPDGTIPFKVVVRSGPGHDTMIDEVLGLVIDGEGQIHARLSVGPPQRVAGDATVTYQQSLRGSWGDDAVMGIAARFDGQSYSHVCQPLPRSTAPERACERLAAFLRTERPVQ